MTTSPVMTITDELLAELESMAAGIKGWNMPKVFQGDEEGVEPEHREWYVGTTDEDGNQYPLLHVNAHQYDSEDSEKLARYYAACNQQTILALLRHIAELKERCVTAEKDARRYAWIRDQHNDGMGRTWVAVYQPGEWVSLDTFVQGEKSYVLNLDMAVDAAIQSEGETK